MQTPESMDMSLELSDAAVQELSSGLGAVLQLPKPEEHFPFHSAQRLTSEILALRENFLEQAPYHFVIRGLGRYSDDAEQVAIFRILSHVIGRMLSQSLVGSEDDQPERDALSLVDSNGSLSRQSSKANYLGKMCIKVSASRSELRLIPVDVILEELSRTDADSEDLYEVLRSFSPVSGSKSSVDALREVKDGLLFLCAQNTTQTNLSLPLRRVFNNLKFVLQNLQLGNRLELKEGDVLFANCTQMLIREEEIAKLSSEGPFEHVSLHTFLSRRRLGAIA